MAIAINGSITTDNGTSTVNVSFAHTVASGSDTVLFVSISASDAISNVQYDGEEMNLAVEMSDTGKYTGIWYLVSPNTGSNNVTFTLAGRFGANHGAMAMGLDGVSSTPIDDSNTQQIPSSSAWTNEVTATENGWTLTTAASGRTSSSVTDTERYNFDVTTGLRTAAAQTKESVSAGANASGWTQDGTGTGASVAVAIAEASSDKSIDVSDSLTLNDVPEMDMSDYDIDVSDALTITEDVSLTQIYDVSVSDALTITEDVSLTQIYTLLASDAITLTESATVENPECHADVSDALTITEDVTVEIGVAPLDVDVSDSLTITEDVDPEENNNVDVSDSITLTEDVTMLITELHIDVSDAITVTEFVDPEHVQTGVHSDALTITEDVTALVSDPNINVSDSLTLTDVDTVVPEVPLEIDVSDAITVSEESDVSSSKKRFFGKVGDFTPTHDYEKKIDG